MLVPTNSKISSDAQLSQQSNPVNRPQSNPSSFPPNTNNLYIPSQPHHASPSPDMSTSTLLPPPSYDCSTRPAETEGLPQLTYRIPDQENPYDVDGDKLIPVSSGSLNSPPKTRWSLKKKALWAAIVILTLIAVVLGAALGITLKERGSRDHGRHPPPPGSGSNTTSITSSQSTQGSTVPTTSSTSGPSTTTNNAAPLVSLGVKYIIKNSNTGTVILASPSDGSISGWQEFGTRVPLQEWIFEQGNSSDSYYIRSGGGTAYLAVSGVAIGAGSPIQIVDGSASQQWKLERNDNGPGCFRIMYAGRNGLSIDLANTSPQNGTRIDFEPNSNSGSQTWVFSQVQS